MDGGLEKKSTVGATRAEEVYAEKASALEAQDEAEDNLAAVMNDLTELRVTLSKHGAVAAHQNPESPEGKETAQMIAEAKLLIEEFEFVQRAGMNALDAKKKIHEMRERMMQKHLN